MERAWLVPVVMNSWWPKEATCVEGSRSLLAEGQALTFRAAESHGGVRASRMLSEGATWV